MVEKLIMINWGYVLILFLLGFLTYKRKSLDALGSVVMIIMGVIIIFSAGFNWLLLILIFLILSLAATKFSKSTRLFEKKTDFFNVNRFIQARHYHEWSKYEKKADGTIQHGVMSEYMNTWIKKKTVSANWIRCK